jgi:hypothetical protein
MEEQDGLPETHGLIERARAILLTPQTEWNIVAAEPRTRGALVTSYVLWMAALGPVALMINTIIFGRSISGIKYRPTVQGAIINATIDYGVALLLFGILYLSLDYLARYFDGQSNRPHAFKLAAYGSTAWWVAGLTNLVPGLGIFMLVGQAYSLYLVYLGATPLMKVPHNRAILYVIAVLVVMLIAAMLISAMISPLISALSGPPPAVGP